MPAVTPRYKPNGVPMCSIECLYYKLLPMDDEGWQGWRCNHPDADSEAQPVCAPAIISLVKDSEDVGSQQLKESEGRSTESAVVDVPSCEMITPAESAEWQSLTSAAPQLDTTVEGLRARCRRAKPELIAGRNVADLGGGILAIKFGKTWRVRVPGLRRHAENAVSRLVSRLLKDG